MSAEAEKLLPWLRSELGWEGAAFSGPLSGGNSNLTWRFEGSDASCVVRTSPAATISPTAHRGIAREHQVLAAVQGHVRPPRGLGWCDEERWIGRPFLVVECVDGVAITDTLPDAYAEDPDAPDRLGFELIDCLAEIHGVPLDETGLSALARDGDFLKRQIDRWLEVRRAKAVRDLPPLFTLGQWLIDHRPPAAQPALVHGDYHLDNTLASTEAPAILAVIDWELATVGDPYTDLGLALMLWGNDRRSEPPAFAHLQAISRRPGTVSRRALAERWSARTGRDLEHLDFYLAFAFWRLAAIVEGAYCLYVDGEVESDYARNLEFNVPALLREAERAAHGDW